MSKEIVLDDYAFLVSETDEKGIIIFANDDFCKIAGYGIDELIGKPHNTVRHPDMPKAAFKDLWETVKSHNQLFPKEAYPSIKLFFVAIVYCTFAKKNGYLKKFIKSINIAKLQPNSAPA